MTTTLADALNEVAAGCRALFREGHNDLTLGHLSLRDPDGRGAWIKRAGIGLGEVNGPADFVLVGWDGEVLAGHGARHKEWPIHTSILQARPDVMVAGHTHPFHAAAFSALDVPLACVTNEATYLGSPPGLFDATTNLVDTIALGDRLAQALGPASTVLMRNHGVSFVGGTVAEAVLVGVFLERACRSQLAVMATGQPFHATPAAELAAKRQNTFDPGLQENFWRFLQRGDGPAHQTVDAG